MAFMQTSSPRDHFLQVAKQAWDSYTASPTLLLLSLDTKWYRPQHKGNCMHLPFYPLFTPRLKKAEAYGQQVQWDLGYRWIGKLRTVPIRIIQKNEKMQVFCLVLTTVMSLTKCALCLFQIPAGKGKGGDWGPPVSLSLQSFYAHTADICIRQRGAGSQMTEEGPWGPAGNQRRPTGGSPISGPWQTWVCARVPSLPGKPTQGISNIQHGWGGGNRSRGVPGGGQNVKFAGAWAAG